MKKIISMLMLLLLFVSAGSFAQQLMNTPPRDGVVDMADKLEKKPIPYPWIRNSDYVWQKRIWRVIDMREKMNQPMYFPEVPHNNWKSFMTVLVDALKEGSITAYDASSTTDEFIIPLSYKEVMAKVEKADSTQMQRDYPPYDFYDTVIIKKFHATDVKKFRIKEDWFFDKQRSMMEVRIIGICPIIDQLDSKGDFKGYKPLFWIYFPEARTVLAKSEVFNRFNGAAKLTYDDFFWKRMFSSYIYKEDNVYDRSILEYAQGIDAMLESDRIKNDLFTFEQQLWEY
ncbi:MAG: gliding motility protein GldN [Bacteroidetes bacterium]|nr:gliding motility protein GldN [Bacteroidota bacterium]